MFHSMVYTVQYCSAHPCKAHSEGAQDVLWQDDRWHLSHLPTDDMLQLGHQFDCSNLTLRKVQLATKIRWLSQPNTQLMINFALPFRECLASSVSIFRIRCQLWAFATGTCSITRWICDPFSRNCRPLHFRSFSEHSSVSPVYVKLIFVDLSLLVSYQL